jgi:hypothetical protein
MANATIERAVGHAQTMALAFDVREFGGVARSWRMIPRVQRDLMRPEVECKNNRRDFLR